MTNDSPEQRQKEVFKGATTTLSLEGYKFVVDDTPHCMWDKDVPLINRYFLSQIDPDFFRYVADRNEPFLETDEKHYAAATLRMAYSHALETLFALLCACIQARHCPAGWMLKYKNNELRSVVTKITQQQPVRNLWLATPLSWDHVACIVINERLCPPEKLAEQRQSFSKAFRMLAADFLERFNELQYNSVKHGMRAGFGDFRLDYEIFSEPEMTGPPDASGAITNDFGAHFFDSHQLSANSQFRHNFYLSQHHVGWNPRKYADGTRFIALCIHNVVALLKAESGEDLAEIVLYLPEKEVFDAPWSHQLTQLHNFTEDPDLTVPEHDLLTKQSVFQQYIPHTV